MNRRQRQIISRVGIIILLAVLALFINFYKPTKESEPTSEPLRSDVVEVHFIDVGQGDSILIEAGDSTLLIDAGENNKGAVVVDYLKSQDITALDYVIGTHPHSDHIGGLDTVLNTFGVSTIIMPSVSHTTKTFEDVLNVIEEKNYTITKAVAGNEYRLGPAVFTIIAPNSSEYEDLNNYSVAIKLTYGNNSFLLTGDVEVTSEEEMLKSEFDLASDVLKLPHHGSAYSISNEFLDAVNPSYAVVSVGRDNKNGHPHVETLKAIKNRGIKLFRTDDQGTVVFTSDGTTISVNTEDYYITENDLID